MLALRQPPSSAAAIRTHAAAAGSRRRKLALSSPGRIVSDDYPVEPGNDRLFQSRQAIFIFRSACPVGVFDRAHIPAPEQVHTARQHRSHRHDAPVVFRLHNQYQFVPRGVRRRESRRPVLRQVDPAFGEKFHAGRVWRPARVRIRSRNPCTRARRRLLGWKVRLPLATAVTPCCVWPPRPALMTAHDRRDAVGRW